jgi:hypothetical protein
VWYLGWPDAERKIGVASVVESMPIAASSGGRSGTASCGRLPGLDHSRRQQSLSRFTGKVVHPMAQQTTVTLTDDIDGGKAAETVSFGLDGKSYEIDLSKRNAAALRKALADYAAAGRRVRSGRQTVRPPRAAGKSVDAKAIREWASTQGLSVSARGRVPADVVEKYHAAQG